MSQITDPKVVELSDDRTDTYLRAIRPEINPQLQASYVLRNLRTYIRTHTHCMYVYMAQSTSTCHEVYIILDCCGCVSNITR